MKEPDLRGFALWAIKQTSSYHDELDGCDLQDALHRCGLLYEVEVTEPCGEFCECMDYGDFPMQCYRTHPSLIDSATSHQHEWKCASPGMYDTTYVCTRCGARNIEQMDNLLETKNPEFGCSATTAGDE